MEEKINNIYLTRPYIIRDDSQQAHYLHFEIMDTTISNLSDLNKKLQNFSGGEPITLYLKQKERID